MNELQDFEYVKFKYGKELHDVFGTVLDAFPNMSSAVVSNQVYLWNILQFIKHNTKVAIESNLHFTPKYVDGRRNTAYEKKKKQMPAICYNARFNGYKDLEHLKTINNLMFLDIDDFKTRQEALEYKKEIINKYNWILACNLSLSKLGLHILIMVDRIVDNEDFNRKYDYISTKFFGRKLDKTSKSLTRYTVIPYDYDIFINEAPQILNIDAIINADENSTRSGYNTNMRLRAAYSQNQGTRSAHIGDNSVNGNDLGTRSVYKKEIICTPYTFSNWNAKNTETNEFTNNNKLRFSEKPDESLFIDVNQPLYYHQGVDIIHIKMYPYIKQKVEEGNRTSFIGALTIQMLYLNHQPNCPINEDIRLNIWKFILSTNKKYCDPPLSCNEVIKSFNANCKKFESGNFDISGYRIKQRSFWSKDSTLSANQKRKITCKIKNEPIIAETKCKIKTAMETIIAADIKLTQEQVAITSGLSLSTVKKYRAYYQELKEDYNRNLKCNDESDVEAINTSIGENNNEIPLMDNHIDSFLDNSDDWLNEIQDVHDIPTHETIKPVGIEMNTEITEEQISSIINRIFERSINRLTAKMPEIHSRIRIKLASMADEEKQVAIMSIIDAMEAEMWNTQSLIDNQLRLSCMDLLMPEQVYTD